MLTRFVRSGPGQNSRVSCGKCSINMTVLHRVRTVQTFAEFSEVGALEQDRLDRLVVKVITYGVGATNVCNYT